MAIDADGSPHAYCPKDSGLTGLDYLANAGQPYDWYGIVTDQAGNPVIQGMDDPAPGYYISTTSLVDKTKAETDPLRYVDSEQIPYISVPGELRQLGVKLGDLCSIKHGIVRVGAIVGDVGPRGKYGEGSIALAEALGIPASPKHGGVDAGVEFLVFSGTTSKWPMTAQEIQSEAMNIYLEWGGDVAYAALA